MAFSCIEGKAEVGKVSKAKVATASKRIDEIVAALTAQGEDIFSARQQADARYLDELKLANTTAKWRLIHKVRVMNGLQKAVDATPVNKLAGLGPKMIEDAHYEARAIHHKMMSQVTDFLQKNALNIKGQLPDKAQYKEFLKALRGEATTDLAAKQMADAVNHVNEEARKTLNSLGYNIGKLDNWGITQTHDQLAIHKATLPVWRAFIDDKLDWSNMIDPKSGIKFGTKPSDTYRMQFLSGVYDNIVYGRDAGNPVWGDTQSGKALEQSRVFQFKDTDSWLAYNTKFGGTDPHNAILSHFSVTARRIALARKFGADAQTALNYMGQITSQKMKDAQAGLPAKMIADAGVAHAMRMEKLLLHGAQAPVGWVAAFWVARPLATLRKVLSSALLDRAIIISAPSDLNSTRIAASAIGMNPANIMSDYVKLMADNVKGGGTTKDDLLRMGHIFDTWANPGVTMARYAEEFPAAAWADKLSNAAMRWQGMNAHTDGLRVLFQRAMGGHFMSLAHLGMDELPDIMKRSMADEGITPADWDAFRSTDGHFTAPNGATFLDPLYWRHATTMADPEELFLKMQSFVERWTDQAVPTTSLKAAAFIDPSAWGQTPGTPIYELAKSVGMFKSFPLAFIDNQLKQLKLRQGAAAKTGYALNVILSSTVIGAMGIQIADMSVGKDPRPMDEGDFWWSALLRGGGLGPIGDLISTGTTSWGGGLAEYASGPVVSVASDAFKLTLGNVAQAYHQAINGDDIDTHFMQELFKFQRRYTPMGQSPIWAGGAAIDRLLSEQLQMLLDPGSANALAEAEQKRVNLYGNASWWGPGKALPERGPDWANALGRQQ
ncbi:MAG: hypothetical protein JWQ44_2921 [Chthoniobacter sp.]|nr:hypothetical protein [Chthoniobacter sp.]